MARSVFLLDAFAHRPRLEGAAPATPDAGTAPAADTAVVRPAALRAVSPGLAALALALVLGGCAATAEAPLPAVPTAASWREAGAWAPAQPADEAPRGDWWTLFGDPELDALERRLDAQSPDLAAALARYDQARAASALAGAAQGPSVSGSANVQRDRQSRQRPLRVLGPNSPDLYDSATLTLDLEYEIDLWGRVRQQVASARAAEAAAQADLASARLSLQAQLADQWIALRGLDRDAQLLRSTEAAYARALDLVRERHDGGIASGLDLARAQAQLEATRSQLRQSLAQRAVVEHAVAALVGESPSTFSVATRSEALPLPSVPTGLPSQLLQRRPDIAAAQRRVAAANASLGVARTAFFPSVTLSAMGGLQTSQPGQILAAPNTWWAIGPTLALALFDGGRRAAGIANAQAQLDEAGARYRGQVLAAFQQVEDSLALIRETGAAADSEAAGLAAARRALALSTARYTEGAASYLEVVASQAAALQAERGLLDLGNRQRRATVTLVKALGGGWSPA